MKSWILTIAVSLLSSTSSPIFAKNPPITCPSTSAIQSVKFNYARQVNGQWGAGVYRSNFNTDYSWFLMVEGISATDEAQASKIGSKAVKSLSFVKGPTHVASKGYDWDECDYTTALGYHAYASAFSHEN
jgi:hypothetical protein